MVLKRISFYQGRRDENPNLALARDLAESRDIAGINEIAANLSNPEQRVRNDCVKVLYEIGAINPELIAAYANDFLQLLEDRNNRLVWGGMTALSAIAELKAEFLCQQYNPIIQAIESGSVITRDQGVRVLAVLAASTAGCNQQALSDLLALLKTCRPKDVPQYAEIAVRGVNAESAGDFVGILENRLSQLTPAQSKRVRKVIRDVQMKSRMV